MKVKTITVTEASRNFADCLNRVHYQGTSFVLLKNGKPMARIIPESDKVCTGKELAEALAVIELPAQEARAWHRDIVTARNNLQAPSDKWE